VPEICRFYGIIIKMFFNDHQPPHFHAEYGGEEILVAIDTLAIFAGGLPPRATGLVIEWATLHKRELNEAWYKASTLEPVGRIDPLP